VKSYSIERLEGPVIAPSIEEGNCILYNADLYMVFLTLIGNAASLS